MTTFRLARADAPSGSELIALLLAELTGQPGWVGGPDSPSATPAQLAPPGGAFLLGWRDGTAVACGAIKRLDEGLAELKRLYVIPAARSQGVARDTMIALADAARALGYVHLRTDTGRAQGRALCLSMGYVEIADCNANPNASFWGEKDLGMVRE